MTSEVFLIPEICDNYSTSVTKYIASFDFRLFFKAVPFVE